MVRDLKLSKRIGINLKMEGNRRVEEGRILLLTGGLKVRRRRDEASLLSDESFDPSELVCDLVRHSREQEEKAFVKVIRAYRNVCEVLMPHLLCSALHCSLLLPLRLNSSHLSWLLLSLHSTLLPSRFSLPSLFPFSASSCKQDEAAQAISDLVVAHVRMWRVMGRRT